MEIEATHPQPPANPTPTITPEISTTAPKPIKNISQIRLILLVFVLASTIAFLAYQYFQLSTTKYNDSIPTTTPTTISTTTPSPMPTIATFTLSNTDNLEPPDLPETVKWLNLTTDKRFTKPDIIWRSLDRSSEGIIEISGSGWFTPATNDESLSPYQDFRNALFNQNWEGTIPLFTLGSYELSIDDSAGISGVEETFYKIVDGSVRFIRISDVENVKVFISNIYSLKTLEALISSSKL